jgi:hypothetical protein
MNTQERPEGLTAVQSGRRSRAAEKNRPGFHGESQVEVKVRVTSAEKAAIGRREWLGAPVECRTVPTAYNSSVTWTGKLP